jgi:chromosome segregation ATPase
MSNKWIEHVRNFREENPDVPYRQALVDARATYNTVKEDRVKSRVKMSDVIKKTSKKTTQARKMKSNISAIKQEMDDLCEDRDELEDMDELSKAEKADLKSIKARIRLLESKLEKEMGNIEEAVEDDDVPDKVKSKLRSKKDAVAEVVGQIKLKKQNPEQELGMKGGSYGLTVLPMSNTKMSGMGRKMSQYGGII